MTITKFISTNLQPPPPPYISFIIMYGNSALSVICIFFFGGGRGRSVPDFENEANRDSRSTFQRGFPALAGIFGLVKEIIFPGLAGLVGPALEKIFLSRLV